MIQKFTILATNYAVKHIPTFMFFQGGNIEPIKDTIIGAKDGRRKNNSNIINYNLRQ